MQPSVRMFWHSVAEQIRSVSRSDKLAPKTFHEKKTGLVSNSKNGNLRNFTTFFSCFRHFFYVFLLLPPPIRPWKPIIPTVLGRTSPHGSVPQCPWPRRRVPPCGQLPRCCRPSNASGQCGRRDGGDDGRWAQPGLLVNDGNTNLFSKKSPTGPAERTPKPEYLVALAKIKFFVRDFMILEGKPRSNTR